MSAPHSRRSLIALAVAQACAFAPVAMAESAENVLPEVVVTSESAPDGIARNASVGGFTETPLLQTPASISVITAEQMQERSIRTATDAVKYDASVQNSYNAVGLSDWFAIRGFTLDMGSNYRKDGMVILAHSAIPMENKERLEILKGLAGLQAGTASSGGILNYVTKRPTDTPLRSATFEVRERGTIYSAIDLGGRSEDKRFGYRINAAAEDIKSYVKGSNGDRRFVSGAFDWRISPRALLQVDMDYQHKSQLTVPGFQLLGPDNRIPTGVSGKTMLNNQPWSRPVTDDTNNLGIKFEYELNDNWRTTLQANKFELRRDDAVALASGCANINADPMVIPSGCGNPFVGYNANGDFAMYDLRRENDKRTVMTTQAMLQGNFTTGGIKHALTTGISTLNRRDNFADYLFDFVGYGNIYNTVPYTYSLGPTNPVVLRRKDEERSIFVQDILSLNDQFKLHAGLRYTKLKRVQFDKDGANIRNTDGDYILPNVALVYSPKANLSLYASYSQGLEPGGEIPSGNTNAESVLDPNKSKQVEVGIKTDLTADISVSAALFQIKRDNEYLNPASLYVVAGKQVHRGLELAAQGRATRNLMLGASFTALQANMEGTGDANVEGKRVGNVPKFKSAVYVDYALPQMPAVKLNATWIYSTSKVFAPNSEIAALNKRVDGYHVLNVGARYATKISGKTTTFRFGIDNVFNKFYWGDAANAFGGYLIPGAPRLARLSAQVDF
ncbi:TonB-dependent siderophore receptor [Herminiimonas contaminans]|uniref:TonB-dependent siderophore receptor n=1 Tax=Herminiimonas contaminans TaxID=1111140 RepID=A0ABS0EYD6_9BURK|nr:TonB-dependent siderophore receptor [Herminiimonas contaminans]MBF8178168.1 TonB-dependent siderophore receptor [Herminiimonas contaminans]